MGLLFLIHTCETHELNTSENGRKEVVKLVGNAATHLTDDTEPLAPDEALLHCAQVRIGGLHLVQEAIRCNRCRCLFREEREHLKVYLIEAPSRRSTVCVHDTEEFCVATHGNAQNGAEGEGRYAGPAEQLLIPVGVMHQYWLASRKYTANHCVGEFVRLEGLAHGSNARGDAHVGRVTLIEQYDTCALGTSDICSCTCDSLEEAVQ